MLNFGNLSVGAVREPPLRRTQGFFTASLEKCAPTAFRQRCEKTKRNKKSLPANRKALAIPNKKPGLEHETQRSHDVVAVDAGDVGLTLEP